MRILLVFLHNRRIRRSLSHLRRTIIIFLRITTRRLLNKLRKQRLQWRFDGLRLRIRHGPRYRPWVPIPLHRRLRKMQNQLRTFQNHRLHKRPTEILHRFGNCPLNPTNFHRSWRFELVPLHWWCLENLWYHFGSRSFINRIIHRCLCFRRVSLGR